MCVSCFYIYYKYIYIYRERERERERDKGYPKVLGKYVFNYVYVQCQNKYDLSFDVQEFLV